MPLPRVQRIISISTMSRLDDPEFKYEDLAAFPTSSNAAAD
jgi:hypothetical protein